MIEKNKKRGFTLIEVLVASSIFVVVISLTTTILFDIIKVEKRSEILNAVYDDSRVVMQQLATLIHNNAIDYDEYYSVNVIQPTTSPALSPAYGMYHGVYSSRFYDPGLTYDPTQCNSPTVGCPGTNPENLGIECTIPGVPISQCRFPFKLSKDKNTGKNPYDGSGSAETDSNAICDLTGCADDSYETTELYLINAAGDKKTIIGKQFIKEKPTTEDPDDAVLAMLELDGIDSDQNGIADLFTCNQNYQCNDEASDIKEYLINPFVNSCPPAMMNDSGTPNDPSDDVPDDTKITALGLSIATQDDLKVAPVDMSSFVFIPITQFRSTVKNIKFIINPIEDPYKGYAEAAVQSHPSVTILLTMQPSAAEMAAYPGDKPPPITIQRTVTTGVHQKVESYPPTNELGWLKDLVDETGS